MLLVKINKAPSYAYGLFFSIYLPFLVASEAGNKPVKYDSWPNHFPPQVDVEKKEMDEQCGSKMGFYSFVQAAKFLSHQLR